MGTGTFVMAGRRGPLGRRPVLASVNLVPLLWTGVPTPSAPADRQDPLPIFRCPATFPCCPGLPSSADQSRRPTTCPRL